MDTLPRPGGCRAPWTLAGFGAAVLEWGLVGSGALFVLALSTGAKRLPFGSLGFPVEWVLGLGIARGLFEQWRPGHAPVLELVRRAASGLRALPAWPRRVLLSAIVLLSTGLALRNAFGHPGFFSGDDVEIHLMTFEALFGLHWPIWQLRSAFYPMLFVYPVQAALHGLGVSHAWPLIASGRCVGVAFAAVDVLLVYAIAEDVLGRADVALLAAFLLGFNQLHVTFGGTDLPRTVSSSFVLLCFWGLRTPSRRRLLLAAAALGVAQAIRFSEGLFLIPAAIELLARRRKKEAVGFCLAFFAAWLAIQGVSDALYWGAPFSSLFHMFRYTLVEHASSRGYQGTFDYLRTLPRWSNPVVVLLAIFASRRRAALALWSWTPLVLLSLLPHKEPRYLIPEVPFLCLLAADGLVRLLDRIRAEPRPSTGHGRWWVPAGAALLLGTFAYEATHFDFIKEGAWIPAAELLESKDVKGRVAFEDHGLHGGARLYSRHSSLVLLSEADLRNVGATSRRLVRERVRWLVLRDVTARSWASTLTADGFREVPLPRGSVGADHLYERATSIPSAVRGTVAPAPQVDGG